MVGRFEVFMRLTNRPLLVAKIAESGLSHREIAGACRLKHHSMVGHLTSGRLDTCSRQLALRLARVLRFEVTAVFEPNEFRVPESSSVKLNDVRAGGGS